jgi:hypothetical protein
LWPSSAGFLSTFPLLFLRGLLQFRKHGHRDGRQLVGCKVAPRAVHGPGEGDRPRPVALELTGIVAAVMERAASATKLDTPQEAGAKGGRGKKALDNVKGFGGNDGTYLTRRIARARPSFCCPGPGTTAAGRRAIQWRSGTARGLYSRRAKRTRRESRLPAFWRRLPGRALLQKGRFYVYFQVGRLEADLPDPGRLD